MVTVHGVTHQRFSSTRGFSLVEIALALVIVAGIAGVAWPTYRAYERRSSDRMVQTTLLSLEPELARVVAANNDVVPNDLADQVRLGNLTALDGDGASSGSGSVSLAALPGEAGTVVAAMKSGAGACWILATNIDTDPRWAVDRDAEDKPCTAQSSAITSGSVNGTQGAPSEITL